MPRNGIATPQLLGITFMLLAGALIVYALTVSASSDPTEDGDSLIEKIKGIFGFALSPITDAGDGSPSEAGGTKTDWAATGEGFF